MAATTMVGVDSLAEEHFPIQINERIINGGRTSHSELTSIQCEFLPKLRLLDNLRLTQSLPSKSQASPIIHRCENENNALHVRPSQLRSDNQRRHAARKIQVYRQPAVLR